MTDDECEVVKALKAILAAVREERPPGSVKWADGPHPDLEYAPLEPMPPLDEAKLAEEEALSSSSPEDSTETCQVKGS